MRGTPGLTARDGPPIGIIPAYAGNTRPTCDRTAATRDHPRVCGEHWTGSPAIVAYRGSSPRMRGTRVFKNVDPLKVGIIPAYAGNTYILYQCETGGRDHPRVCGEHQGFLDLLNEGRGSSPPPSVPRDHPRVCGEHCYWRISVRWNTGSSPRMRGTLRRRRCPTGYRGIIPAYAGNTFP